MRSWNQSQGCDSDVLEHRDTYGQAQVCSKGPQRKVSRSTVFLLDQVLACTEYATSGYSNTSQCVSALPGDSAPLNEMKTAASRGGNERHSRKARRGGGGSQGHIPC